MTDILDRIATRLRLLSCSPIGIERARTELVVRDGKHQVTIGELVVNGGRTIVVLADIGPESIASPRTALGWASKMGAGAIALVNDRYVVRIAVALDQVDSAPWMALVHYAGKLANDLAGVRRTRPDVSGLSHFGG